MARDKKLDRRDRKIFGHIVSPPSPRRLTNRRAPSPSALGLSNNCWGFGSDGDWWNMIALPFQMAPSPPAGFKFRLLMNQYDEELRFTFVDDDVPNRGLLRPGIPDPTSSSSPSITSRRSLKSRRKTDPRAASRVGRACRSTTNPAYGCTRRIAGPRTTRSRVTT